MARILVDRPSPRVYDTFTDVDSTSIASHTPNITYSGGWSQTASNSFYIQGNKLQPNRYADGDLAVIETGFSDMTLESTVIPFSTSGNRGYPGVVFRYTDSSNFWYVFPDSDNKFVKLYSVISGSHIQRIYINYSATSGTPVDLKVVCKGQNIILFINGVEQVTFTSSFNQTATKIGVRCGKSGTPASPCSWSSLAVRPAEGVIINWPILTELSTGPIISLGTSGTWDSADINNPNVVYDVTNNRWVLTYSGYKNGTGNVQGLGNAYATNLLGLWTKEVGNPVFGPSGGSYGQNGGIVKKGNTYYYYYGSGGATTISLATSTDLTTWSDQGVVLSATTGSWDTSGIHDAFARLRPDGITIEVWYSGQNPTGRGLGYATSTDGVNFTKYYRNPVLVPLSWAASPFTYGEPSVFVPIGKENKQLMVSFDSADGSSPNTRFISQAVTIDGGTSWHYRVAALEAQPDYAWEDHQVFDSFMLVDNNTFYLFHSGSDQYGAALDINIQIGVASGPFTSLIGG